MHEYSLTQRIVGIVNETAQGYKNSKVTSVRLVIGENTSIIPDCIQLYYDMIAQGTQAAGARLDVRTVKPQMHCPHCGRNFERRVFSFECPDCGTPGNPTDIGNEAYVESIELEDQTGFITS